MITLTSDWLRRYVAIIKPGHGLKNRKKFILNSGIGKVQALINTELKILIEKRQWWRRFRIKFENNILNCSGYYRYARKRYDRKNYKTRVYSKNKS